MFTTGHSIQSNLLKNIKDTQQSIDYLKDPTGDNKTKPAPTQGPIKVDPVVKKNIVPD